MPLWIPILASAVAAHPAPVVVVELFTSEGCSSCPDADQVLADLADMPHVTALGFHVDYWDRLGWRDPLSSPGASLRQDAYRRALGRGSYTPQMVINGRRELVGSDEVRARALVADALDHDTVAGIEMKWEGAALSYTLDAPHAGKELVALVVEDHIVHRVARGENAGRTLRHARAVRWFHVQTLDDGVTGSISVEPPPDVVRERAKVVLLLQDKMTRLVEGAGELPLVTR